MEFMNTFGLIFSLVIHFCLFVAIATFDLTNLTAQAGVSSINIKILDIKDQPRRSALENKVVPKKVQNTVKQSGVIEESKAELISSLNPEYPLISRLRKEEGSVEMSLKVDQEGFPFDIQIKKSSGFKRLDQAALSSVQSAKYRNESGKIASLNLSLDFKMRGK